MALLTFRLRTQPTPVLVFRGVTQAPALVYRVRTQAPVLTYRTQTLAAALVFRTRTFAPPAPRTLLIEITPDGHYLRVSVPRPVNHLGQPVDPDATDGDGNALRQLPVVHLSYVDGRAVGPDGVLITPGDDPLLWRFRLGPLPREGVFVVTIQDVNNVPDGQQHVLCTLRLQQQEGRMLLTPPADYNPAAADLELWIGACTLAFEGQHYAQADALLEELSASFLTL